MPPVVLTVAPGEPDWDPAQSDQLLVVQRPFRWGLYAGRPTPRVDEASEDVLGRQGSRIERHSQARGEFLPAESNPSVWSTDHPGGNPRRNMSLLVEVDTADDRRFLKTLGNPRLSSLMERDLVGRRRILVHGVQNSNPVVEARGIHAGQELASQPRSCSSTVGHPRQLALARGRLCSRSLLAKELLHGTGAYVSLASRQTPSSPGVTILKHIPPARWGILRYS